MSQDRQRPIDFFGADAKERVATLVAELERESSAEVVVTVYPRSASYRDAEWLAGTLFAAAWLLVFLYHPVAFDFTLLPVELGVAFAAGALVTRAANPIKRALAGKKTVAREVDRAAKTAFHDLGISRTRARTGLLVFVSVLEGRARIVGDVGVPKLELLSSLMPRLDRAVRRRDLSAFAKALAELRPVLGEALPKTSDDQNELPNELLEGT